jgi:hypothetical protein
MATITEWSAEVEVDKHIAEFKENFKSKMRSFVYGCIDEDEYYGFTGKLPENSWDELSDATELAVDSIQSKYRYISRANNSYDSRSIYWIMDENYKKPMLWSMNGYLYSLHPEINRQQFKDNGFKLIDYHCQVSQWMRYDMIQANKRVQIIQTAWRKCITNPKYLICRRKILRWAEDDANTLGK